MILDGYTMEGTLNGGNTTLRFRYRPMVGIERRQYLESYRGWPNEIVFRERCRWLQTHIEAMHPYADVVAVAEDHDLFGRLTLVIQGIRPPDGVKGWSPYWEAMSAINLRTGVRLALEYPLLDRRSCANCQKWWFSEDTGRIEQVEGCDSVRPPEFPVMCKTNEGCPVGTPENSLRLTAQNRAAFDHFRQCEAVNAWPNDPIVARNALIIRRTREEVLRERRLAGHGIADAGGGGNLARNRGQPASTRINGSAGSNESLYFHGGQFPFN